jgi:hypothetical protein
MIVQFADPTTPNLLADEKSTLQSFLTYMRQALITRATVEEDAALQAMGLCLNR